MLEASKNFRYKLYKIKVSKQFQFNSKLQVRDEDQRNFSDYFACTYQF